ncbi:hypothetical protein PSTT_08087 [Puccinia striiformis]|uniref:DUF6589 domain-containing protein n=1 Tax=Puccinia striiformis TaxID=27350 RepID=A0A2S4VDU8_9BASI|nr:hypothetical protein PSTT_08087 [Puccinia striiformis]
MPFLYNLLKSKLQQNQTVEKVNFGNSDSGDDSDGPTRKSAPPIPVREATPKDLLALDDILNADNTIDSNKKTPQTEEREGEIYNRADQSHVISSTICAMVAFGTNRRDNALQIQNATAHQAIRALGKLAKKKILRIMSDDTAVLAPIICIDNINFEESVHDNNFSLEKYHQSILDSATMPLKPSFFLATQKTSYQFQAVIKSQITQVLLEYIAKASDTMVELHQDPPSIDPIAVKKPNITMLKLMVASINSAQGMGEVFEGIIRQTGLTATKFYSKLRVFKGDLGTCMNLKSLHMQRKPSGHSKNSLLSIFTLLDSNDLGAWQTLSALGLLAEQPTTRKEFSLMMTHLTKCHEASILYCLFQFFSPEAFAALDDEESDSWDKGSEAIDDSDGGSGSSEHSEKAKDSPVERAQELHYKH